MISVELARELRDAGLLWVPSRGDRFIVDQPDMADDVFVLSDMTTELHHFPSGPVIGFNGTTEWALDSVATGMAVWLPAEEQLREALGAIFRQLAVSAGRYTVTISAAGSEQAYTARDAAEAYGAALLATLRARASN